MSDPVRIPDVNLPIGTVEVQYLDALIKYHEDLVLAQRNLQKAMHSGSIFAMAEAADDLGDLVMQKTHDDAHWRDMREIWLKR